MEPWARAWVIALELVTIIIALAAGQRASIDSIDDRIQFSYGENITLECFARSSSDPHNFTWGAPEGSTSLERGSIVVNDEMTISVLTFEAFEEDTGTFTCQIERSNEDPATAPIIVVPAILRGPTDMILEYRDDLTATFTCTAFGGDDAELVFTWTPPSEFATSSQNQILNTDNTTSSAITTLPLSLMLDRGKSFTCDVAYDGTTNEDEATATINIVPAILEDPQSIIIGVGLNRSTNFSCTAYGGPLNPSLQLVFDWSGPDGVDINNIETSEPVNDTVTSTLNLVNVTEEHEGNYSCSVAYSDMPEIVATSEIATLGAVTDPPVITEPPVDVVEDAGNTTNLTCSAVGNGTLTIEWILPSGDILYPDQNITIGESIIDLQCWDPYPWQIMCVLMIEYIMADIGGSYTCIAGNEAGFTEATAVLSVNLYISGDMVGLNTTNGTYENITCMIEGFPISYVWQKMNETLSDDGSDVVNGSNSGSGHGSNNASNSSSDSNTDSEDELMVTYMNVLTGRVLEFDPVVFGDEGVYRCVALSGVRDELISGAVTVTISPEDGVSVVPVGEVYDEGDNVTLLCSSLGGPGNTLQWFRDDENITSVIEASDNNLTLTDITVAGDGGVYMCVASNAAGMGEASVSLNISPEFIVQPVGDEITDGTNVSFTCVASAFPEPEYMWFRVDGELPVSAIGVNSSTLILSPAVFGDQGQYYCIATSSGIEITSDQVTLTISPEGGVLIEPDNETFDDLDTVVLNCMTEGGPGNVYQWSFDGEEVENETLSNLILVNVTAADGGPYTCNVTNAAGYDTYTTYVFISPMITIDPVSRNVSNGTEDVTFSCDATGFPQPEFEWFSDEGLPLPDSASGGDTSTLTIDLVLFGIEGQYYCTATSNNLTVESERATLSVAPLVINISSDGTIAFIGEDFLFMCNVSGGPNNEFQWTLNSVILPDETMSTLRLTNVAVDDAGVYSCTVTNTAGESSSETELFIAPNIITSPQDITANATDIVMFTCVAEGAPVPNITWEYAGIDDDDTPSSGDGSGSEFSVDTAVSLTTVSSNLTLEASFFNYGEYSCVVTSDPLMLNVSATAILSVAPSVSVSPSDINSDRDVSHEVTCTVLGGPDNEITWEKLDSDGILANTSVLVINVTNASVGGVYQCTAENLAGSDSATTTVNVIPVFSQSPEDINVTITEDLVLECSADGFPLPSIEWTHNGTVVQEDNDRVTITEEVSVEVSLTSRLTVGDTSLTDSGEYRCIAMSTAAFPDVNSSLALVLIQDTPEQPQNLTALNITSRSITLQWMEPHHNNAPVTGYIVMYTEPDFLGGGVMTVLSTEETIVVTGLHPGVEYVFTVVAENDIGESVPSDPERATTLEEVPSDSPQNVMATALSSTEIEVSWEEVPAISRNGIIVMYEVQYEPLETFDEQISIETVNITDISMLSTNLTGLEEYVEYNISVRAYTSIGPGPYSVGVTTTTDEAAPDMPPVNITATAVSFTEIEVTWEEVPAINRNGEITMYEVMYDPLQTFDVLVVDTVNISMLSTVLTDLEEYVEYNISVRAYTSTGPGPYSDPVTVRTLEDAPDASPQNVMTMVLSSTEIEVTWEEVPAINRSGVITMYEVQYEPLETFDDQIFIETINTSGPVLILNLTGLEEYVEYSISVRAYTSTGPGPYSDPVTVRTETDDPVEPPQNVTVTALSSTEIAVSWEEVPPINRNGIIAMYEVQYVPLETFDDQISIETVITSGPVLILNLTGLEEYVEYNIIVRAYTSTGPGPYSDPVTVRTDTDNPDAAPQEVMVMVISSTEIAVSWEEVPAISQNGEIIMYEVQYEPLEPFDDQISIETVITSGPVLMMNLTGLEEYVQYNISVRAYTSTGPGPYSDPVTVRTLEDVPDAPPQNVMTMVLSSTEIEVTWEEVPAINRNGIIIMYEVQYEPLETFDDQLSIEAVNTSGPVLMLNLTDLEEYIEYNISVRAYTSTGSGSYSDPVTVRTLEDNPVEPPQNVTASALSSTEIEVSWEEVPAISQNGEIIMYEVRYEPLETFNGTISIETVITSGSILMLNLTGPEEYVEYNISVRAYTSTGPGPYSDPVTVRTLEDVPDAPPQNVMTMVLSSTEIEVTWEEVPAINRSGIITMYEVQYDPLDTFGQLSIETVITSGPVLTLNLTGLEEFVEYNISVRAYTSTGPGPYSDPVTVRTLEDDPVEPPQNIMATALSSTEIAVSWKEVPAINRNGIIIMYEVQYEPLETFDDQLSIGTVNTSGPVLMMNLTDLEEYVEYNIIVRAYTSTGPGPYSDPVTVRTLEDEPAAPPTNVTIVDVTSTTILLNWTEVPAIQQNGIITQYEVEYNQTTFDVSTAQTVTVNSTAVLFTDENMTQTMIVDIMTALLSGLHEYVEYSIRVRAYTSVGPGPYSGAINVTTDEDVPSGFPLNITATTLNSTEIRVNWTTFPEIDHNGILTEYEVQFNQSVANNTQRPPSDSVLVPANITTVVLTDLGPDVLYTVTVRALTTVGPGPYSPDPDTALTDEGDPDPPPKPPEVNDTEDISLDVPLEESVFTVIIGWKAPAITGGRLEGFIVFLIALGESGTVTRQKRQTDFLDNGCVIGGINNNFTVSNDTMQLNASVAAYTTYEFRVQAFTANATGNFSEATIFTTPESIPTLPKDLLVQYNSSTSLVVTWDPPLCDYGIRTNYMFKVVGNGTENMAVLGPDNTTRTLPNLYPNTPYTVTICASTSVGCGPVAIVTNKTDEDIPDAVSDLTINAAIQINNTAVNFSIEWGKPSDRFGPFNYRLVYEAIQGEGYPESRRQSIELTTVTLESTVEVGETHTFEGALPFADYSITITPVNIKLQRDGESVPVSGRTIAIAPTAVTELSVEPESSTELMVSWELPDNPNGPLSGYVVYYREQTGTQPPLPVITSAYNQSTVDYPEKTIVISGLDPFTNYAVIVRANGTDDLEGLLTEDSVAVQITHTDTDTPPITPPTSTSTGDDTFYLVLPDPLDIDTGPVIFYAIIVIRITDSFNRDSPPDVGDYLDAMPYNSDAEPPQQFYITAAWEDPTEVPRTFTIGDGTITKARDTTYENVGLSSDTDYAYIVRFDIMSNTNEMLVFYTDFEYFKTDEKPSSNAVAVGVSVTFVILFLVAVVVALVLVWVYLKRHAYKSLFEGEIAANSDNQPHSIQMQPVVINPHPVSPYSGTMEPIPLDKFKDHVERMHSNDDYLFSEEYNSIEPNHAPTSIACHLSCNIAKNRYANIVSYDHSRVKLTEDPNKEGSDYINANHIDGYKQRNGFIAAQGPNPDTVDDFWRMVWEQSSATIVMLTNLEEKGRVKCHQYWPDDKSSLHGRIRVHLQETLVLADYTQRSFSLQMNGSKEERIVTQYHYTVWPDHGVPEYPTSLLHFVRKVMSLNPENSGPVVVHCSAGVGRTGTFMTLYAQLQKMEAEKNIDIFGYVRAMRYKRNCMVQTEPQYVFIHDALLEAIECGVTEVPARELNEQYKQLCEVDVEQKVTGLAMEFDKIDRTIHRKLRRNTGTLHYNKSKNRYGANPDTIPYDRNRCRLNAIPGVEGSDYINASFVDGYHKTKAFIATQGPLPDTQDDFWKLIWQQGSASVVMLTKEKEGGKAKCHRYWPLSGAEQYGKLQVIFCSSTEFPDYALREFKLVDTQDGSSLNVKQFQYTDWPEESVPPSGSGLIDLIGQVQKWQRSSGDKPIVVHCSGGCGRTGTYVAVSILIERLKTEGVVDVFHTVRNLRLQRPGMVQTEAQLAFCYKTTLEYLESFELYDNFK